jgi:hypothetical protein
MKVIALREPAPPVLWSPTFAIAVDEAVERKRAKHDFFERVMDRDVHYGVIPGTGTKPTLLKSGAEMLLANMGLQATFLDAQPPIVDITGELHGEPYISFRRVCKIYRQLGMREDDRMIVAQAEGSCSNWEVKYRYRTAGAACPACGKPLRMSKENDEWYCWKKKDGCGKTYPKAMFTFERIVNPDPADVQNTVLKMADKRALVAATLIATGCSDIFTQDVEDFAPTIEGEVVDNVTPIDNARGKPGKTRAAAAEKPAAKPTPKAAATSPERAELQAEIRKIHGIPIDKPNISRAQMLTILADMETVLKVRVESFTSVTDAMMRAYVNRKNADTGMSTETNNHLFALLTDIGVKTKDLRLAFAKAYGFPIDSYQKLNDQHAKVLIEAARELRRDGITAWSPGSLTQVEDEPAVDDDGQSPPEDTDVHFCNGCGRQIWPEPAGGTVHDLDCDIAYPDEDGDIV